MDYYVPKFFCFPGSSVSLRLVAAAHGEVEVFDDDDNEGGEVQVVMTTAEVHAPPRKLNPTGPVTI